MSATENDILFAVEAVKADPEGSNDWYQLAPAGKYGQRAPREGELLKPTELSELGKD